MERAFTVQQRSGRRREATREEILSAAQRLLEQGEPLAALSVNRIAAEAGVSRATFYLHFPGKRDLLAQLAAQEVLEWDEIAAPFFANPEAGRDELERVAAGVVAMWREHAGVLGGLVELAEYDTEARETWRAAVGQIGATIAAALRERSPELTAAEADTLGQMVAWMGERSLHQMVGAQADDETMDRVAHALTDAVWRIAEARPRNPAVDLTDSLPGSRQL
ncbi:MAG: helix-turn-helix domain-containing protein [Solirubrobacterales bacterium]